MISIIIPAFNSEKTIARAINSVLGQTYSDYEIIVVDDGSTDGTAEVIRGYGDKVNYIYQENAGVSVARNTAVVAANGEWLAFLDADDEWLPGKLQKQMELLKANPQLKWCCTNRDQSDGKRKAAFGNEKKIAKALQDKDYFESYFLAATKGQCPIITTCLMIHKSLFDELGSFDPQYVRGQDLDMWWRIAHHYPQIGYVAEPLAIRYLDDENPVTKQRRLNEWKGDLKSNIISNHLNFIASTKNYGNFRSYVSGIIKESLVQMICGKHTKSVKDFMTDFKDLIPFHFKILIKIALISPIISSFFFKFILNLFLSFKRQVVRKI